MSVDIGFSGISPSEKINKYREKEDNSNVGIGIDIINNCNARCPTCYYEHFDDLSLDRVMSPEKIKRIIDQSAENGFSELYLLGGEPSIYPLELLTDIIRYAKEKMKLVLMVTNGLIFEDEEYCKKIMQTGVSLSVQKHTIVSGIESSEELFRKRNLENVRFGINTGFEKTKKAFENIEKYFDPKNISIQCSITRDVVEHHDLLEIFMYARKKEYNIIIECVRPSMKFLRGNKQDLTPEELTKIFLLLQKIDQAFFPHLKPYFLIPPAYGFPCTLPKTGIHVLINGDVNPCVGQPYKLGNIFSQNLKEILENPARDFFRFPEKRIVGYCSKCKYLEFCTGGCRGESYDSTGNSQGSVGCFNASAIQCPEEERLEKIKNNGLSVNDILPENCDGCLLKGDGKCRLNPEIVENVIKSYIKKN
jgi:radical SAM protein with 4Fe4S-binding SPASM domain